MWRRESRVESRESRVEMSMTRTLPCTLQVSGFGVDLDGSHPAHVEYDSADAADSADAHCVDGVTAGCYRKAWDGESAKVAIVLFFTSQLQQP